MTKPAYGYKAGSIPAIDEGGSKVHVIAGEYLGKKGAFQGKYIKLLIWMLNFMQTRNGLLQMILKTPCSSIFFR